MESTFDLGGGLVLRVREGDLCAYEGDCVANAANNHFWMGAGVAGALKRAGGAEIEREAAAQGPVPVGGAVLTGGGRLPARHVVHGAVMGQDLITGEEPIRAATEACLALCRDRGLRSVAFPAFGTGVGGFPLAACARVMLGEVERFASAPGSVGEVAFVLFGAAAYRVFEEEARRRFPHPTA